MGSSSNHPHGSATSDEGGHRQLQWARCIAQLLPPIVQFRPQRPSLHLLPLPRRVVAVLERGLTERRRFTRGVRRVQEGQLAKQDTPGPPIVCDVVDNGHQDIVLWTKLEEDGAKRRLLCQIERPVVLGKHALAGCALTIIRSEPTKVLDWEMERCGRQNLLHHAGAGIGEAAPSTSCRRTISPRLSSSAL